MTARTNNNAVLSPTAWSSSQRPVLRKWAAFMRNYEWEINVLLFLIPLVLGYLGFRQFWAAQGKDYPFLALLYESLQLFVLEAGEAAGPVNPALETARWLAPAVTVYAAVKTILALLSTKLLRLRVRGWRGHALVCGWNDNARRLIQGLRGDGRRVAVLMDEMTPAAVEGCQELRLPLFSGEITSTELLGRAGAARAAEILCVHQEDAVNVALAAAIRQLPIPPGQQPPTCFVHITDALLFGLLVEADLKTSRPNHADLEYFNPYARGARDLLNAYPLLHEEAGPPPRLLVAGLGPLGERLVIHAVRIWWRQGNPAVRLPITLVAPHASARLTGLVDRYPVLRAVADWRCLDQDPLTLPGHDFNPFPGAGGPILAFVCLEDDGRGLTGGLLLARAFEGQPATVVAALNGETAGFATLLGLDGEPNDPSLRVIGWRERVCSVDLLRSGITEVFARAQHEAYVRAERAKQRAQQARGEPPAANAALVPWEELAESYRQANRDQASDLGNKLKAIGCTILEDLELSEPLPFTAEELDRLSQMEHDRWVRERQAQGWVYGPVRDNDRKIHPDLILWDELTEEAKEKDRVMIRNIPNALAKVGLRVYRLPAAPGG